MDTETKSLLPNHNTVGTNYTETGSVKSKATQRTVSKRSASDDSGSDAGTFIPENDTWGREKNVSFLNILFVGLVFFFSPFIVIYFWICLEHFEGSLFYPLIEIYYRYSLDKLTVEWLTGLLPVPTRKGFYLYFGWLAFHGLAYLYFPSNIGYGQETPAGHVLPYRVNGFRIWILTHALFFIFTLVFPVFDGAIIAENWGALLVATNVYGYFLTFFSYYKAQYFPTHPEDRKFSGSKLYDLVMGIELNPRLFGIDFKLFHNGRPGITAWTLINISFAYAQYKNLGYVTNSLVALIILHGIYVVDFFYNEDWYLRTIDIAHDHFGYYLAWGDSVWLPFMYTLQSFYLYRNPIDLSIPFFWAIMGLGLGGYFIFRECNNQKDIIRKAGGKGKIWGYEANVITAKYKTSDGETRVSYLLASGYWGLARHFNYFGDLMMCLAFCLTCGLDSLLPYFYFFYMIALLVHRTMRDQNRCKGKYGPYWDKYCELVPYKIVPYIF
ncbi:ERG4/ERG24 ergosterol biosynthesis protein [Neoconidiobolus thromboides FSU 785]|nr:ERG4/ERG24 ergosterol biosynthesis protein [Neoconidiobolus thromboides FSU 785]